MNVGVRLLLLVNLLTSNYCAAASSEQNLNAMRTTFLQAEQYIRQDRDIDYFALADTLKGYPLYPYLQYQWLIKHLDDDRSVQMFLYENPDSRYAMLLHRQWLSNLGRQQKWAAFITHYKKSDDTALQCYLAQAQYQNGQQQTALENAIQLWSSGQSQPAACDGLFETLKTSSSFTTGLVWRRFQAALQQGNSNLAKHLLPLLPNQDQAIAKTWLKLHASPQQVRQAAAWKQDYPQSGLLFAHAINRWLEDDPQAALAVWDAQKQQFKIPAEVLADTEKNLGMGLAFRRDKRAYARLAQFAGDDPSAREWRVRAALSQQDWPNVLAALASLNEAEKREDKWQYWQARALAATGQQSQAQAIYRTIAQNRSFYAFVAADYLQQNIALGHRPVQVSEREIEALQNNSEFQAVKELLTIDRRPEAIRQWWHAVAELDAPRMQAAAKLAQQWRWPSIAIFTIAKANHWDDMDLRFPLPFKDQIETYAQAQQLDPAIVFALIRQESAFDEFAGSSAGAIGLMQIMPKTAQQIAGELKQSWHNDYNLLNPDINIRYGSYYFKKTWEQFDGHLLLAAAAYNAGAQRVRQWLPKHQALPGDIWLETIPYKETRGYVASIVMYALIYQQRLHRNSLKLPELLPTVKPG